MTTRSRKLAEAKTAATSRVGASTPTTTSIATTSRMRAVNTAPAGPTRATRANTKTPTAVKETKTVYTKKPPVKKTAMTKSKSKVEATQDGDREPIQAFLRIRPNHQKETHSPYLVALSDTTVQMTDPSSSSPHIHSLTVPTPPIVYTFSHIFAPSTTQHSFFTRSALPLVRHLLEGQNSLLFAYGVTNSGKTYSIQGGRTEREAGILPRTLDVVFRSIDGLSCEKPLVPIGLGSVEIQEGEGGDGGLSEGERKAAAMIDQVLAQDGDNDVEMVSSDGQTEDDEGPTKDTIPVSKEYEYAVWVSYAEVYNEKIFDLLSVDDSQANGTSKSTGSSSSYMNLAALAASTSGNSVSSASANSGNILSSSSTSGSVTLRRRALGLKASPDGKGKYVHGLRNVRVKSAEEAKDVLKMGVVNRRVFGTLANKVSSRSHAIFTIKVAKVHKGMDGEDILVSRLSIVDLAGSERARNVGTMKGMGAEGERLREAGSINKSLMVLGQCLEALRINQKKLAVAGSIKGDAEKPRLAIVPFRYSKITEIFQDFFVGEGRAVMIININPYDTGFDENSHVMRFAAIAREVTTSTATTGGAPKVTSFLPPSHAASRAPSRLKHTRAGVPALDTSVRQPVARKVVLSLGSSSGPEFRRGGEGARPSVNTVVDVIEDDEDDDDQYREDEGGAYPLVEELFTRIDELELKLFEAEMRAAMIETETREEVAAEMQERMEIMDRMYRERLSREAEENDRKTDEKMDLLSRVMRTGGGMSPVRKSNQLPMVTERTAAPDIVTNDENSIQQNSLTRSDDEDDVNASPSARYGSHSTKKNRYPSEWESSPIPTSKSAHSRSPSKAKAPTKLARAASIEVSDSEPEPEELRIPDLKKNPIMDMEEEEEAKLTDPDKNSDDETETEEDTFDASQAEECDEDESAPPSSEGEGDAIGSEEISEDEEEGSYEDEEDEDMPTEYVFEPLRETASKGGKEKGSNTKAGTKPKATGKAKRVIESSEEESFDIETVQSVEDELDFLSPSKTTARKFTASKGSKRVSEAKKKSVIAKGSKARVVEDMDMDELTHIIGKTALGDVKGRTVRRSTRARP